MPYIDMKITTALSTEQKEAAVSELGRLITLIPGKTEAVTMINISDSAHLALNGKTMAPGAWLEVKCYGKAEKEAKKAFTEAVFAWLGEAYGIAPNGAYLVFDEKAEWGAGGTLK